jgi:hypothetical protein
MRTRRFLGYDATAGEYIYSWMTEKAWANTYREHVVKLKDGTEHQGCAPKVPLGAHRRRLKAVIATPRQTVSLVEYESILLAQDEMTREEGEGLWRRYQDHMEVTFGNWRLSAGVGRAPSLDPNPDAIPCNTEQSREKREGQDMNQDLS